MDVLKLKTLVSENSTKVYYKENGEIKEKQLKDCTEDLDIIAIVINAIDSYSHCYTECLNYYYYKDLTEEEKKKCWIHEEDYTGYCFGSNRRKIEVPNELKIFGFTNALRDYYENDSSD